MSVRCKPCSGEHRSSRPKRVVLCEACGKEIYTRRSEARFCSIKCANKILAKEKSQRLTPLQRKARGIGLKQWHAQTKAEGRNVNKERWQIAKQNNEEWVERQRSILIAQRNTNEYKLLAHNKQSGKDNFFLKMSADTYENLCRRRSEIQKAKWANFSVDERAEKLQNLHQSRKEYWENRTDDEIKAYSKKRSEISKKLMQDDQYKENILTKIMQTLEVSPNGPELLLIAVISELNLYFKYSGDGNYWIAGKNPDFINSRDKKIIEMNGCYWHHCSECYGEPWNIYGDDERINHFAKYGYDTLIIWEHELREKDLTNLKNKILSFAS